MGIIFPGGGFLWEDSSHLRIIQEVCVIHLFREPIGSKVFVKFKEYLEDPLSALLLGAYLVLVLCRYVYNINTTVLQSRMTKTLQSTLNV